VKFFKGILRNPAALVILLAAFLSLVGVIYKAGMDEKIARIPILASQTAEAKASLIPALLSTSTPFSGRIPFNAPTEPQAINPELEWDAGFSELSQFALSGTDLLLTAGPYTWPGFPAIIYKAPLSDNFDVQVKIVFSPPAEKISTAQMAGMAIRPLHARLVVGNASFPAEWVIAARYLTDAGSLVGSRGSWMDYSLDSVYLRLERNQNILRYAYSENGKNWTWLNVDGEQQWQSDTPLEIALFAYSDTQDAISAKFSDWIISVR
jgi:hypothetical protein